MFLRTTLLLSAVAHGAIMLSPEIQWAEPQSVSSSGGLRVSLIRPAPPTQAVISNQPSETELSAVTQEVIVPEPKPETEFDPVKVAEPAPEPERQPEPEFEIASLKPLKPLPLAKPKSEPVVAKIKKTKPPAKSVIKKSEKPNLEPKKLAKAMPLPRQKQPPPIETAVKVVEVTKAPTELPPPEVVAVNEEQIHSFEPPAETDAMMKLAIVGGEEVEQEQEISEHLLEMERAYTNDLLRLIESHKRYPKLARKRGHEGVVMLSFVVQKSGSIAQVAVANSSNHKRLDRAAEKLMERIGQFRPIPQLLGRNQWAFQVPIRYSLQ